MTRGMAGYDGLVVADDFRNPRHALLARPLADMLEHGATDREAVAVLLPERAFLSIHRHRYGNQPKGRAV